jgi:hypothetical protein
MIESRGRLACAITFGSMHADRLRWSKTRNAGAHALTKLGAQPDAVRLEGPGPFALQLTAPGRYVARAG